MIAQALLLICRLRSFVLVAIAAISGVLALHATTLRVSISTDDILPASHPYVLVIKQAREKFGAELPYIVVLTNDSGPATALIKDYTAFSNEALALPNIKQGRLLSLSSPSTKLLTGGEDGLSVRGLLDDLPADPDASLKELRSRIAASPAHQHLFLSEDGKSLALYLEFTPSAHGYSGDFLAVDRLAEKFRRDGVSVRIGGQSALLAETELMSNRMGIFFPIAIVIIGLLHLESFRSWQAVFLPVLTGLVAVIWSVGLFSMLGFELDPFNALAPVLILAVGAGHAVQVLKRYTEVYQATEGPPSRSRQDEAIARALADVAPPLLAAAAVAVSAFLALTLFDSITIQRFGFLVAFGIIAIVVVEFTLIPALRSMLPPPKDHGEVVSPYWRALTSAAGRAGANTPWLVMLVFAVLAAAGAAGIPRIDLTSSMKSFFAEGERINQANTFVNAQFAGTDGFYVLLDAKPGQTLRSARVMEGIAAVQAAAEADAIVTKTLSVADFVSQISAAVEGRPGTGRSLPSEDGVLNDALGLYELSAGPNDFEPYVSADYLRAIVRVFVRSDDSQDLKRVEAEIYQAVRTSGLDKAADVVVGGGSFGPVALSERIVPEKIKNVGVILVACFVVSALVMRSVWIGLACCVPIVLSGLLVFGLMGWVGIPLQTVTATLGALCLGIGADYAIYLAWRLRQETQREGVAGIAEAVNTSGRAVLFVASAITGGYAVLGLSLGFHIHQWMALLVGVAMIANALAALFVLPALFRLFGARGRAS